MAAVERPALRAARALYRRVAHSRLAALVPVHLFWWIRRRLLPMRSSDVLTVVGELGDAGVRSWLVGGWGVDALLGRQTRRHGDLDLALDLADGAEARACNALRRLGFALKDDRTIEGEWSDRRLRLQDGAGRIVELLLVDIAQLAAASQAPGSSPVDAFAPGTIDGTPVDCLSPALQLAMHLGYEPYGTQRHDVRRLCRRFRLPIPEPYR